MPLPASGQISLNDFHTELGTSGQISLNDQAVRDLIGKASGSQAAMSEYYGASAGAPMPNTISQIFAPFTFPAPFDSSDNNFYPQSITPVQGVEGTLLIWITPKWTLYKSTDYGATWTAYAGTGTIYNVNNQGPRMIYALNSNRVIYHYAWQVGRNRNSHLAVQDVNVLENTAPYDNRAYIGDRTNLALAIPVIDKALNNYYVMQEFRTTVRIPLSVFDADQTAANPAPYLNVNQTDLGYVFNDGTTASSGVVYNLAAGYNSWGVHNNVGVYASVNKLTAPREIGAVVTTNGFATKTYYPIYVPPVETAWNVGSTVAPNGSIYVAAVGPDDTTQSYTQAGATTPNSIKIWKSANFGSTWTLIADIGSNFWDLNTEYYFNRPALTVDSGGVIGLQYGFNAGGTFDRVRTIFTEDDFATYNTFVSDPAADVGTVYPTLQTDDKGNWYTASTTSGVFFRYHNV